MCPQNFLQVRDVVISIFGFFEFKYMSPIVGCEIVVFRDLPLF